MTVAAFMDLALYDREFGYYARAARRSGRAGDFFSSVDVGRLFGELLEVQIAEMAELLRAGPKARATGTSVRAQAFGPAFDLVEAGAGNGRLSADILRAAEARHPELYARLRLHLVEASAVARSAQGVSLGGAAERLASSSDSLPASFDGVLIANELLDALPVHQVVMREDGLREVYVDLAGAPDQDNPLFVAREAPPSTSAIGAYLERAGARLEPGWRAEVNLNAVHWIGDVARRLGRGFLILIDYGHDARELYSATHAAGTLTTYSRHLSGAGTASYDTPVWLQRPGGQDITAHVDFSSIRAAGEAAGLTTLGFLDQTYFLLGLAHGSKGSRGSLNLLNLKQRLALKTLLMPGGLGSTHKVLIFGKGVGRPPLAGCSYRMRVT